MALPRVELEAIVREPRSTSVEEPVSIEAVLGALAADDVDRVRACLRAGALLHGTKGFVTQMAEPLARRVGELWADGRLEVRHEHLLTALLATQLRLLTAAAEDGPRGPVVLLATLPGEPHVLGLEMVAAFLAAGHAAPRMLGADTPPADLAAAARALSADVVGVSISSAADARAAEKAVRALQKRLPDGVALWLGGAGAARVRTPSRAVRRIASFSELDAALVALGR